MAGLLEHDFDAAFAQTTAALPCPQQLAALGTVLCLYRPQQGGELSGWAQSVRAEAQVGVDSDGLRESLSFFDRDGRCCWRLWLLPDSDFLAWDRLLASLPNRGVAVPGDGIGERLWQRLARRLTSDSWRACVLRLHAMPPAPALRVLAASPAALSALGVGIAREIARAEGAEIGTAGLNDAGDDCCCVQAAIAAAAFARNDTARDASVIPLIPFQKSEQP